jgi:hypothetical protein
MPLLISKFNNSKGDLSIKLGQFIPDEELNEFMSPRTNTVVYASYQELTVCCDILGRRNPSGITHGFFGDNAKEIVGNWNSYQKEVNGVTPD